VITQERLIELLRYNSCTGDFVRIKQISNAHPCGGKVGSYSEGYLRISIDGKSYLAHRLAWLYMTGKWPENEIDHININRRDNRWCNLRRATHGQNQQNQKGWGASGIKGVHWRACDSKWCARIGTNGRKFLGYFHTKEAAHAAYVEAAKRLHGEFARAE